MCSEQVGVHVLGPSVVSAVVLQPRVNLYHFLFSCPFLLCCLLGARLLVASISVGRFLPLWCVCSCVYLAAGSVRACFLLCLCRSVLSFCWSVWSFLFLLFPLVCFFVLFSLRLLAPRAALLGTPWTPWEISYWQSNSWERNVKADSVTVTHDV